MKGRRWAIVGVSAVAGALLAASAAWACVSGPSVNLSTVSAKPGQEVHLTGSNFQAPESVTVRWNALDGPVVATLPAPDASGTVGGAFSVPVEAGPGSYVLIVAQSTAGGRHAQTPARALLTVTSDPHATSVPAAAPSAPAVRMAELTGRPQSVGALPLLLVGLGVAGLGMLAAAGAALLAGHRREHPQAVRARS